MLRSMMYAAALVALWAVAIFVLECHNSVALCGKILWTFATTGKNVVSDTAAFTVMLVWGALMWFSVFGYYIHLLRNERPNHDPFESPMFAASVAIAGFWIVGLVFWIKYTETVPGYENIHKEILSGAFVALPLMVGALGTVLTVFQEGRKFIRQ